MVLMLFWPWGPCNFSVSAVSKLDLLNWVAPKWPGNVMGWVKYELGLSRIEGWLDVPTRPDKFNAMCLSFQWNAYPGSQGEQ